MVATNTLPPPFHAGAGNAVPPTEEIKAPCRTKVISVRSAFLSSRVLLVAL